MNAAQSSYWVSFDKRYQYRIDAQSTASTHIQGQRSRAVHILVAVDPHQGVTAFVQRALQADDDELERVRRVHADVVRDLRYVGVVKGSVYLV